MTSGSTAGCRNVLSLSNAEMTSDARTLELIMRLRTLVGKVPGAPGDPGLEINSSVTPRTVGLAERILSFLSLVMSAERASWS